MPSPYESDSTISGDGNLFTPDVVTQAEVDAAQVDIEITDQANQETGEASTPNS